MSQAHIDLIRRGFEAFNRGDWDAALEFVAEDVVWGAYLASMDGEKAIFGHESLRRTWQAQRDDLGGDDFRIEARDIQDLGAGSLLVKLRVTGRGTASGVPVRLESGLCVGTSSRDSTTTPARPMRSKLPVCRSSSEVFPLDEKRLFAGI